MIKTNQQHVLPQLISILLAYLSVISVEGQTGPINTPCTSSSVNTLTPCMNYITGSAANSSARTSGLSDCCKAFLTLMNTNMNCACLLVTASVPMPLSLSLPKICNYRTPLQCAASGSPLPAPGPVLFAPPPPPNQEVEAPSPSSIPETPSPISPLSPQAGPAAGPLAAKHEAATSPEPALEPSTEDSEPRSNTKTTSPVAASSPAQVKDQPSNTKRVQPLPTPQSASSPSIVSLPTICLTLIIANLLMLYS